MPGRRSSEIRILVIDDHALFREGLVRLLESEPDFKVMACCESIGEALKLPGFSSVDVVLLDYDLGGEKGPEFLSHAAKRGFAGHTLIITAGVSNIEAKKLLSMGASGIFLKHDPPDLLAQSIREVNEGRTWLDRTLFQEIMQDEASESEEALSKRELDVLKSVVDGLTNKEIGALLGMSETSVKAVLQQLFNRTGVRTRSQLVRVALEQYRGQF